MHLDRAMVGRETDAMVAMRLFGWEPSPGVGQEPWEAELWYDSNDDPCLRDDPDGVPFYSSDMNAAWQLAGILRDSGYAVTVKQDALQDGRVWCEIHKLDKTLVVVRRQVIAYAESAALAICRAALALVDKCHL